MKLWVLAAAVALVFSLAGSARSGSLSSGTPDFAIDVSSDVVGGAPVHLTPTLTANPDGSFSASGTQSAPGEFSLAFDFLLNPDPSISGSFTLMSLSPSTQSFTVSATLGGLAFGPPTHASGSYGELRYTNTGPDQMVALSANPLYSAKIDGSTIATLGAIAFVPVTGGTGVFGTISQETFDMPISSSTQAQSIGVAFAFMLTGQDQVQTPFELTVVPEPTQIAFFAISIALILCRIARDSASCH